MEASYPRKPLIRSAVMVMGKIILKSRVVLDEEEKERSNEL
jgi:hypothetical protein